jgi:hypothetical protein
MHPEVKINSVPDLFALLGTALCFATVLAYIKACVALKRGRHA